CAGPGRWPRAAARTGSDARMATVATPLNAPGASASGPLAALLRPRFAVPVVTLAVSAAELAIADRKYGVFSGGFGQSQAVDTTGERIAFIAAYGIVQAALALLAWCLCAWASRKAGRAAAALNFAFLFGGGMLATLVARYQLHSYFS